MATTLKVLLCAAGLVFSGTGCSFPTEDYRTVPTESVTDQSSGNDAGARGEAAPANREAGAAPTGQTSDDDKKKGKEEDD